jgi:sugar phosphate isomerase/epimerase
MPALPHYSPRLAICNETWPRDLPFPEMCARAAATGFTGLELAPFTLAADPRQLTEADAIRLCSAAHQQGLEILGLHWLLTAPSGLHIATPDPLVRQDTLHYAQHLVRFCAMLGGKIMVWGSPKSRSLLPEWDRAQATQRAADLIRQVAITAAQYGVTLAIEPLARKETNFLNTAAETISFCQQVDHPACKLHLDVKAMSDEATPIPEIIQASRDWTVHFHTNDPNLLGPGMGAVDFAPILSALQSTGYSGWLSTEVFDYSPGADFIAQRSHSYLRDQLAALG